MACCILRCRCYFFHVLTTAYGDTVGAVSETRGCARSTVRQQQRTLRRMPVLVSNENRKFFLHEVRSIVRRFLQDLQCQNYQVLKTGSQCQPILPSDYILILTSGAMGIKLMPRRRTYNGNTGAHSSGTAQFHGDGHLGAMTDQKEAVCIPPNIMFPAVFPRRRNRSISYARTASREASILT